MNKFKKGIFGLASLALGVGLIGTMKVDAAEKGDNSVSDVISTATNVGDTRTWSFFNGTARTAVSLGEYDTVSDFVSGVHGYNKSTTTSKSQLKDSADGYDCYLGATFFVPIPTNTTSGTIKIGLSSNSGGRYIDMIANDGTTAKSVLTSKYYDSTKLTKNESKLMEYNYTSDHIWTSTLDSKLSSNYNYIKFQSVVYSGTTGYTTYDATAISGNSGEIKMYELRSILGNGSYGAADTQYTVTIEGYPSQTVTSGEKLSYTPVKYGYDFNGYTLDGVAFDHTTTPITKDITLVPTWTEWTYEFSQYSLTQADMAQLNKIGSYTNQKIGSSIYTYTGSTTTTGVTLPGETTKVQAPCLNIKGAVSTTNGLQIDAPTDGTLKVVIGAGGDSDRSAKLIDSTSTEIEPTSGNKAITYNTQGYNPVELTYTLSAGTYYLGGTDGMRIYSVEFIPTPNVVYQVTTDNSAVRFMARMEIADEALAATNITLQLTITDTVGTDVTAAEAKSIAINTVYGAITNTNGYADTEVAGTVYAIYVINDLTGYVGYKITANFLVDGVSVGTSTYTVA